MLVVIVVVVVVVVVVSRGMLCVKLGFSVLSVSKEIGYAREAVRRASIHMAAGPLHPRVGANSHALVLYHGQKRWLSSTVTSLRRRRWLNSFLLAVSLRDLPRARIALSNLVLLPTYYTPCLSLLVKASPDIHLLKLIHDDYLVFLKKNGKLKRAEQQDVAHLFLGRIVHVFATNAHSKLARVLYSQFAASVCRAHSIEPRSFLDVIDESQKVPFSEMCRIARILSSKRLLHRPLQALDADGSSVRSRDGHVIAVAPATVENAIIQLQMETTSGNLVHTQSSETSSGDSAYTQSPKTLPGDSAHTQSFQTLPGDPAHTQSPKTPPMRPSLAEKPQRDSYGFVSYPELCDYVSRTRFTEYDTNHANKKMFDIYATLSENHKAEFMRLYLQHNTPRQVSVEENCLSMVKLEGDTSNTQTALVFRFRAQYQQDLFRWLETSVKDITAVLLSPAIEDDDLEHPGHSVRDDHLEQSKHSVKHSASGLKETLQSEPNAPTHPDPRKVIRQYHALITIAKPATMVTLILSLMILTTASSGRIVMVSLLSDIVRLFKHACRRDRGPLRQIPSLYSHDDFVSLFTALIAVILPCCTINIGASTLAQAKQDMLLSKPLAGDDDTRFWGENPVAFVHRMVPGRIHRSGAIVVHPWLQAHFAVEGIDTFHLLYLPMLVPPNTWHANGGGYLLDLKPFLFDKNAGKGGSETLSRKGGLQQIHQGLDLLGKIPWAINARVFAVFDQVMRRELAFISIPPSHSIIVADMELKRVDRVELHGLRTGYEHTHSFAAALNVNGDAFYLPHQVDFRGRAYPMVLVLLHHMEDTTRALMMFWEGRPLGPDGFKWIQYQLAGVFGNDKMTMAERLAFVQSHMQQILLLAKHPLSPHAWWRRGENPWQTLALCFEVAAVSAHMESGQDVASFISHCPVHQDGTCNGLQHYAALGRDSMGAAAVNLCSLPGQARGDVYVSVLDKVRDQVALDVKQGNPLAARVAQEQMLSRSLIKQTVMTTVYGVSVFGASRQIYGKMKDMGLLRDDIASGSMAAELLSKTNGTEDAHVAQTINEAEQAGLLETTTVNVSQHTPGNSQMMRKQDHDYAVANYLACLVLNSILSLFQQAKLIERWLVTNCRRVCTSHDLTENSALPVQSRPFEWTLPLGFPIVQQYRSKRARNVATALQSIKFAAPLDSAPINIRKQCNGVAPNFVHSLDATHMYLTAASAHAENLAFAAVHDLYWTFAGDVPRLGRILRQQFVRLHQQDIIGEMQSEMESLVLESLQLVYFKATESPGLADALQRIRGTSRKLEFSKGRLHEQLKVLNGTNKVSAVVRLVEQHNPQLYIPTSATLQTLEPYTHARNTADLRPLKLSRDFIPVLVPVRLIKPPATGAFDIERVLLAPYFFS